MLRGFLICFSLGSLLFFLSHHFLPGKNTAVKEPVGQQASTVDGGGSGSGRSLASEKSKRESIVDTLRTYQESEFDAGLENNLRLLIFSSSLEELMAVRDALREMEPKSRFGRFATALYARWAELSPEEAWASALQDKDFEKEATRGVLFTWLAMDQEAALQSLLESKKKGHIGILNEYARDLAQYHPEEAAAFVDFFFEQWPEADQTLFPSVAVEWAEEDLEAATEWIASYWDREKRNELLKKVALPAGYAGLKTADHIDDPALRDEVRRLTIKRWGITRAYYLLPEYNSEDGPDLSQSFPQDWSPQELSAYAQGVVTNREGLFPNLTKLANNEAELQNIYEGVIAGALQSSPSRVSAAVENINEEFVLSESGSESVTRFFERWKSQEPDGFRDWVQGQSGSPQKELAIEVLEKE